MTDLRDLIGDLKNTSKSSLIYALIMANVLSLSIFLGSNGKQSLDKVKEKTAEEETSLKNDKGEMTKVPVPEAFVPDKVEDKEDKNIKEAEAVEEERQYSSQKKFEKPDESQAPPEVLKGTLQEKPSSAELVLEQENKHPSENKKEKVINFEEAAKEIRSKESAKEKPKALVWHFPKAISKK